MLLANHKVSSFYSVFMVTNKTNYEKQIRSRSLYRYILGLCIRWKQNLKFELARQIARKHGASLGQGVIIPISLARKLNSNCKIGNHVSIQTNQIDTRAPLTIGNHVVIGNGVEIITCSHNIDSPEWEYKQYGLVIEDYVWIPTKVLVLPSCRKIGYGAVVGAGSVVVQDVDAMSVVSGNPARELRKRKCVHADLVVESLLGGDYKRYKEAWNGRRAQNK